MDDFHALVARQGDDGITAAIETLTEADLPPGEVTMTLQSVIFMTTPWAVPIDAPTRCGHKLSCAIHLRM